MEFSDITLTQAGGILSLKVFSELPADEWHSVDGKGFAFPAPEKVTDLGRKLAEHSSNVERKEECEAAFRAIATKLVSASANFDIASRNEKNGNKARMRECMRVGQDRLVEASELVERARQYAIPPVKKSGA